MDLLKTKIFLDKLNREYARMSKDPENIVRLDIDIMLAYVRDLYDALLSDAGNTESMSKPASVKEPVNEPPAPVAAQPPVSAKPAAAEPEDKPAPAPPPPPVVVEPVKSEEPLPTVTPKAPTSSPISFPAIPPEAEALFEHKEATELSEKLSNQPIPDLLKAIGLNDKLLLTRELFGDDSKAFENSIGILNGFDSMDQARKYLLEHCVMRYRWTDKKRLETAKKFVKLVRRRYT
ncbi:MAG: hypothetical protein H6574_04760 [Lewinellaceae bacterium]|nr:hypothetical protein [Saprospiraceae bacterium]MCB9330374.1 hypothetical protein [Lewinellaceae bacterium]